MRFTICLTAALALCACQKQAEAPPAADNNVAEANTAAPAPTPAAFQLNETTWTFTDKDGTKVQESIDTNGNYIANSAAGKHLDHGTSVMKDDKACFTSAMDKKGEICWTTQPTEIGQSMDTTSDKGEKLTVTRVAYVPLEMPKS
jgi:hypothetical protein